MSEEHQLQRLNYEFGNLQGLPCGYLFLINEDYLVHKELYRNQIRWKESLYIHKTRIIDGL